MKLWIFLFFFASVSLHAQPFTFGPKVGVNFSSLNFNDVIDVNGINYRLQTKDAKIAAVAGVFFRVKVKNFLIMPEVLFTQDRGTFVIYNLQSSSLDSEVKQIQFNKIDFPLGIGYKIGKSLRFNLGLVGGLILSNEIKEVGAIAKFASKLSTGDLIWNWQAGIGFDIRKRMTVDFRYEGNLGVHQNNIEFLNQNIQIGQRKNTIQVTIGIALIPFKKQL